MWPSKFGSSVLTPSQPRSLAPCLPAWLLATAKEKRRLSSGSNRRPRQLQCVSHQPHRLPPRPVVNLWWALNEAGGRHLGLGLGRHWLSPLPSLFVAVCFLALGVPPSSSPASLLRRLPNPSPFSLVSREERVIFMFIFWRHFYQLWPVNKGYF